MANQAQLTPEWLKAQKNLANSMQELSVTVKETDMCFAGKVMARKAQTAQDGPFRKVLTMLRTDTKMVHKALKDWNSKASKAKDRKVKKILKASKVPSLLQALTKCVHGVGAAQRGFMGYNAKFNQSYIKFENAFGQVTKDLKQVAIVLKKTEAGAKKMERSTF